MSFSWSFSRPNINLGVWLFKNGLDLFCQFNVARYLNIHDLFSVSSTSWSLLSRLVCICRITNCWTEFLDLLMRFIYDFIYCFCHFFRFLLLIFFLNRLLHFIVFVGRILVDYCRRLHIWRRYLRFLRSCLACLAIKPRKLAWFIVIIFDNRNCILGLFNTLIVRVFRKGTPRAHPVVWTLWAKFWLLLLSFAKFRLSFSLFLLSPYDCHFCLERLNKRVRYTSVEVKWGFLL